MRECRVRLAGGAAQQLEEIEQCDQPGERQQHRGEGCDELARNVDRQRECRGHGLSSRAAPAGARTSRNCGASSNHAQTTPGNADCTHISGISAFSRAARLSKRGRARARRRPCRSEAEGTEEAALPAERAGQREQQGDECIGQRGQRAGQAFDRPPATQRGRSTCEMLDGGSSRFGNRRLADVEQSRAVLVRGCRTGPGRSRGRSGYRAGRSGDRSPGGCR